VIYGSGANSTPGARLSFATANPDRVSFPIEVGHLQLRHFRYAESRAVHRGEHRSVFEVLRCFEQRLDLGLTQNDRQPKPTRVELLLRSRICTEAFWKDVARARCTQHATHNNDDDVAGGMLCGFKGGRAASALSAWGSRLHGRGSAGSVVRPEDSFFKVRTDDGNLYILRHNTSADDWTLESFPAVKY
jgi:hypothetical protein